MIGPGTSIRVVGLDLSLTSTGISDGTTHGAFGTGPDMVIEARHDAIWQCVREFVYYTTSDIPSLVVIEGGAFSRGAQSKAAEDLTGLRAIVRHRLWKSKIPFAMVTPTTLKKFTTGSGQASKQEMVASVRERYGVDLSSVKVRDGRYDQADALALAMMGYVRAGYQMALTTGQLASLEAVSWPVLYSD